MAEPQAAARVDEQRFRRATGRRFVGLSGGATATPTGTSTRSENAAQTQQRGQAEGEEYTFVQLADTQFGMMAQSKSMQWYLQLRQLVYLATCGRNDGKALIPVPEMRAALKDTDDEALLELEIELARKAVKIINRLQPKPRFAVVCGDLTNAFPDKKPAQQDKEVAVFKQIFSQLDPEIELVCVCGNHDVGQKPTPRTIERYKDRFGDDYFSFRVGPDRFVVLNSQLYVDSSQCREAAEAQDVWLDTELFDKKPQTVRHSIAFSHVPPFVWQPDEHHAGFNMPQAARMKLLSRLAQAGFSHIFCGHYHRNAGGIFQRKHLGPIEVVTTAAIGGNIGTDPEADELAFEGMKSIDVSDRLSGMRIVHVGPNGVRHEFRTLRELRDEYREARDAWTSNEDATILKMREAGGKWEDIASALTNQQQGAGSERARSASLVKHRYRKLAAQAS
ncbi:Serine/threonine-protein phosphatase CPPED1 [Hondaea fermentalgiana]|uniref:Serine/threonine-protein phosphatase CPPED1 n=1 Tax=Hondaea fermentalgiana TaxID=2315210 RepID=A0A2R5GSG6_9STRA|nr:Serine/threonine-protein phosphatase CPPED1 [Hondaea fermentalgiana]|eukprot:GBG33790.1 Serine/threonine-protein phosphatase CPPED1 [Hondaea fermentalgiana]